jgi:hypothetical protein
MADETNKHGSLSNVSQSDAGDPGVGNNTMTSTGAPTGQSVTGKGAEGYPSPGQEADRGYGTTSKTEYGTGADMPGTGGNDDFETMKNDLAQGASSLGANAGRGSDVGTGGDTGSSFGLNGARGVGTTGAGGPTSTNATASGNVTGVGSDTGIGTDTGIGSTTGQGASVDYAGDNSAGEDTGLGSTGGDSGWGSEGSGEGMGTSMAR